MGIAAYNRGSRAIANCIQQEFSPGRSAVGARTERENLRLTIDRQAGEIGLMRGEMEMLRGKLMLAHDASERNFRAWTDLDADFRRHRRQAAGMVRDLAVKERQRVKLERCVREHLTPEKWLAWSAKYDRMRGDQCNE